MEVEVNLNPIDSDTLIKEASTLKDRLVQYLKDIKEEQLSHCSDLIGQEHRLGSEIDKLEIKYKELETKYVKLFEALSFYSEDTCHKCERSDFIRKTLRDARLD